MRQVLASRDSIFVLRGKRRSWLLVVSLQLRVGDLKLIIPGSEVLYYSLNNSDRYNDHNFYNLYNPSSLSQFLLTTQNV
ncbi:hypothetical protein [Elizabethkingia meningoseptica]|uniref:hypothetical protein n=1 Tax=Elizabethkingia meningoseptica TaxID=238 RepID=UPI0038924154